MSESRARYTMKVDDLQSKSHILANTPNLSSTKQLIGVTINTEAIFAVDVIF